MRTITEQQDQLFQELRQLDPSVIDDGIVDEAEYTAAPCRLMFVLKEVNGGSGWSLRSHLKNGGRQQTHDATWDNIARWAEGIFMLPRELAWAELEKGCKERRKAVLKKICAVNIKKTAGSYESHQKDIRLAAQEGAALLQKQLALYLPDLIICCGTADEFTAACFPNEKPDWQMTTRGVWYYQHDGRTVISFSHPAARVKDCYLYYALLDAVKEIFAL